MVCLLSFSERSKLSVENAIKKYACCTLILSLPASAKSRKETVLGFNQFLLANGQKQTLMLTEFTVKFWCNFA